MREREQPHLKSVPQVQVPKVPQEKIGPSVEIIDAPPAVQYGGAAADVDVAIPSSSVAEAAGLPAQRQTIAQVPPQMVAGIDWGYHALLVGAAAVGGGIIGFLSSGTARGTGTGALTSVALQGLITAIRGSMLSQPERLGYGALTVGTGAGAGYLFWTDRRRGGRRR